MSFEGPLILFEVFLFKKADKNNFYVMLQSYSITKRKKEKNAIVLVVTLNEKSVLWR